MRLLTPVFLEAFAGKVINIHPALLPSFPGVHGGADAINYGVKVSGCTVHFVEEKVDSGPVLVQAVVPVNAGESRNDLMSRIHVMEHHIYPQAIQWLAQGRIDVQGRQGAPQARQQPPCAARRRLACMAAAGTGFLALFPQNSAVQEAPQGAFFIASSWLQCQPMIYIHL